MLDAEDFIRDQINRDLECTQEMVDLPQQRKIAGGDDRCPPLRKG